jgi:hypothetical protein
MPMQSFTTERRAREVLTTYTATLHITSTDQLITIYWLRLQPTIHHINNIDVMCDVWCRLSLGGWRL